MPDKERSAIMHKVAKVLTLDLQLFDVIEQRGFENLTGHLQSLYSILHHTALSRNAILALYENTVEKLRKEIHDVEKGVKSVSFVTDL